MRPLETDSDLTGVFIRRDTQKGRPCEDTAGRLQEKSTLNNLISDFQPPSETAVSDTKSVLLPLSPKKRTWFPLRKVVAPLTSSSVKASAPPPPRPSL